MIDQHRGILKCTSWIAKISPGWAQWPIYIPTIASTKVSTHKGDVTFRNDELYRCWVGLVTRGLASWEISGNTFLLLNCKRHRPVVLIRKPDKTNAHIIFLFKRGAGLIILDRIIFGFGYLCAIGWWLSQEKMETSVKFCSDTADTTELNFIPGTRQNMEYPIIPNTDTVIILRMMSSFISMTRFSQTISTTRYKV